MTLGRRRSAQCRFPQAVPGRRDSWKAMPIPMARPRCAPRNSTRAHFSNLRGVHPGINQGRIDLAQLNAVSMEMRSFTRERSADAIAQARQHNQWLDQFLYP